MKEEVSIKVKVADRIIRMRVSLDEEEYIRQAVKDLDAKIKDYRRKYETNDYKDILGMIVLELATENTIFKSKKWIEDDDVSEQLDAIDGMLDSYLQA